MIILNLLSNIDRGDKELELEYGKAEQTFNGFMRFLMESFQMSFAITLSIKCI